MREIVEYLLRWLFEVSEHNIATAFKMLRLTETELYKRLISRSASGVAQGSVYKEFFSMAISLPRSELQVIYASIEGALMIGGCIPMVGIAINIIDAIFCVLLGNWIGAFIAIISCFPIPGFKIAGKGLGKVLSKILAKVPILDVPRAIRMLGKKIDGLRWCIPAAYDLPKVYKIIASRLRALLPEFSNPFAQALLDKFLYNLSGEATNSAIKVVPQSVGKATTKQASSQSMNRLLDITLRKSI